jgi:hypothetical protein
MSKLLFHVWIIRRPDGTALNRCAYYSSRMARSRAVVLCTICSGKPKREWHADAGSIDPSETWQNLYRKGYRVQRAEVRA